MTARLLGTLLLACAGAGLGVCGAVRQQAVEKRIRLLSRLWTYLEELLACRALTGPMLLHAAAENPPLRRWPSRRIAIVRCRPYPCQTCPKRWQGSCTPAWPPWGTATALLLVPNSAAWQISAAGKPTARLTARPVPWRCGRAWAAMRGCCWPSFCGEEDGY